MNLFIYVLVTVLILLVLVSLVVLSFEPSKEGELLQCQLATFDPEMLLEKNPILIQDSIVDADEFLKTIRWLYLFSSEKVENQKKINGKTEKDKENKKVNPFAYMILIASPSFSPSHSPFLDVQIRHPRFVKQKALVHMSPGQILILPYGWVYAIKEKEKGLDYSVPITIGLHTLLTFVRSVTLPPPNNVTLS
jgi:hypothetical protein